MNFGARADLLTARAPNHIRKTVTYQVALILNTHTLVEA